MTERGTGGKILSLATKRARRVQEKVLQKMGKSDQTKDDVFQDFVNNFNKQHAAASKLQKEITKFMNATRTLHQCSISLGRTLDDLYESTWAGCTEYKDILDTRSLLWEDQIVSFHSKIVEPMNNYISKFPEVKNRIQKRERKVVDYDLRRRELETLKTKQKVTDQKLQQAEDSYSQAKQLYDEITDELYEELPSFFDSRIQFYASVFQSLAATQAKFHSEMTKVDEDFANLMDSLASEAATAIHTTKKERTLDSTPKLLSRPGEDDDSDEDVPLSPPSFAGNHSSLQESPNSASPTSLSSPVHLVPSEVKTDKQAPATTSEGSGSLRRQPPSKPTRSTSSVEDGEGASPDSSQQHLPPSSPSTQDAGNISNLESPRLSSAEEPSQDSPYPGNHEMSAADLAELDDIINLTETASPPSAVAEASPPQAEEETKKEDKRPNGAASSVEPSNTEPSNTEPSNTEPSNTEPSNTEPSNTEPSNTEPSNTEPSNTEPSNSEPSNTEPSNTLYKVVATHPYEGEDEDELSFAKGDEIAVVPFDDPEDEEDGWLTGVILSSGVKGIFPGNFTKKQV